MKRLTWLAGLLLIIGPRILHAHSEHLTIPANLRGEPTEITLGTAQSDIKHLQFWALSKGNMSQPLDVTLEGPAKLKLQVKARYTQGASVDAQIEKETGWWPIRLKGSGQKKYQSTLVLRGAGSTLPATSLGADIPIDLNFFKLICQSSSAEDIREMLQFLSFTLGRTITREELCSGSIVPDPDPIASDEGSLQAWGLLYKDTCRPSNKSSYVVVFDVDLSSVDRALYEDGITIRLAATSQAYAGETASSIKPISDGRFAPQPLLLMSTVGGGFFGGGESVQVIRFSKKGPDKGKNLKVYDYVYYKNLILTRTPIGALLKGGKATFVLHNGSTAYSVCFKLQKTRQVAGGYPATE